MNNVTLIANPSRILDVSDQFHNESIRVNRLVDEMCQIVSRLSCTWQGDASMAYVSKCKTLEKDISKINSMIIEHTLDLRHIAFEYVKAENDNENSASGLTCGVVN